MKVLDLFAGIGGFTLGLERAGFETVAFCEIEPYAQKVLKKHWPEVPIYDDVRQLTAERLAADGIGVDVITGGFPCQDISLAGRQAGIEGERSGLWGEIARLISELQPRYAIMENVTNLISGDSGRWFGRVLGDLAEIGYDAEWHCIPASAIGAHHHRDRIWILAYPSGGEREPGAEKQGVLRALQENGAVNDHLGGRGEAHASLLADAFSTRLQRGLRWGKDKERQSELGHPGRCSAVFGQSTQNEWDIEPSVGRVANGVPARSHRLKCLGNAVVPQIPELIGREIVEFEDDRSAAL
jgi:DNA (cytosine-5)-methyltransferase 1